jgi:BirA family biotin operon repressor/biotin-[acetyl-CoA-carboxylase] ligase
MKVLDARLLAALRASSVHLPATDLAGQLAAPLPAVEARLTELRGAGFEIEERPGLGFRLLASPDRLIADDLFARLGICPLVREIVVFEETDSTNSRAMQLGRQGAAAGVAIFAERQSAGRGRFGRRWVSTSHRGLWFSLLLRPPLPLLCWPRLTTWAAVALADAIEGTLGLPAAIKWPNDLYLGDKKIAGILAESGTDDAGKPFTVVGIGVNVNQDRADFPPELSAKASSLRLAAGRLIDRPAFATALLRALDSRFPQLVTGFTEIMADAERRSFLLGRWIHVQCGAELLEGLAEKLDGDGHLLLRTADGTLHRLTAGEVSVVANSIPE